MEITDVTIVDAPAARVWELTVDIERLPSITETVDSVQRLDDGPLRPGSRALLRQPGLPARTWVVEECTAPGRFSWATTLAGVRMIGIHELEPVDPDTCQLTLRIRFEGRGAGLLGRIARRSIARALATESAGFARAAADTNSTAGN